jgi:dipeptidyl aminopeptidase/acylaminoacyl peptidase
MIVHSYMIRFLVIGVAVFLLLVMMYSLYHRNTRQTSLKSMTNNTSSFLSSLPQTYQQMSVPYLRARQYKSKLSEFTEYETYDTYSSYLTSYLSDGLKINALITKPTGEMPKGGWPAVVFVHGYIPPTEYVTTEKYLAYVDYLARNGFVVCKIDLRGHGESEGKAGGGYFGSDYVVDTLNAYAAMQSTDFINPSKVGMWGHSMAGNILLRSAVVKKTIPAVVIWAGAVYSYEDQRKYGIQDNSYRPPQISQAQNRTRQQLFQLVGSPSASSPFWSQVAPTNYLTDLKGAIQIHHAVDDDVVNIGYSRDLVALLNKTTVPHEFYEYETGGHNISDPSFTIAMQRTVAFYKKYLK